MKKYFIYGILGLVVLTSSFTLQKAPSGVVTIKGHITATFSYCGGARPSEEMLQDLKTPKPMKNKILYIKTGTANKSSKPIVKKVVTDDNGGFSVELKVGKTYCFLEDWKGKPLHISKDSVNVKWDHACMMQRYKTADFILKVKAENNPVVAINFHQSCKFKPVCGTYKGDLPE